MAPRPRRRRPVGTARLNGVCLTHSVRAGRRNVNWIIDGNNVYGSRPDGWWNDRDAAARRLAQAVAAWCRTHADDVVLVFDAPVSSQTLALAGGNLSIVESRRRGRNAADDHIVELVERRAADIEAEAAVAGQAAE